MYMAKIAITCFKYTGACTACAYIYIYIYVYIYIHIYICICVYTAETHRSRYVPDIPSKVGFCTEPPVDSLHL